MPNAHVGPYLGKFVSGGTLIAGSAEVAGVSGPLGQAGILRYIWSAITITSARIQGYFRREMSSREHGM